MSEYRLKKQAAPDTPPSDYAAFYLDVAGVPKYKDDAGVLHAFELDTITTATVTDITGILKGNGSTVLGATAGTDYVVPSGALGTPSSGTLTNCTFPTLNQNTSGTAANVSGTPALPDGTTATTQSANDGSTKLATTAYADLKLPKAGGTMTGALTLKQYVEPPVAKGSISGSTAFDWSAGSVQKGSLTGNLTVTFSGSPVEGQSLTLILTQGGAYTITWPTVKWDAGTAPTISSTSGKKITVSFFYDGTDYLAYDGGGNR